MTAPDSECLFGVAVAGGAVYTISATNQGNQTCSVDGYLVRRDLVTGQELARTAVNVAGGPLYSDGPDLWADNGSTGGDVVHYVLTSVGGS